MVWQREFMAPAACGFGSCPAPWKEVSGPLPVTKKGIYHATRTPRVAVPATASGEIGPNEDGFWVDLDGREIPRSVVAEIKYRFPDTPILPGDTKFMVEINLLLAATIPGPRVYDGPQNPRQPEESQSEKVVDNITVYPPTEKGYAKKGQQLKWEEPAPAPGERVQYSHRGGGYGVEPPVIRKHGPVPLPRDSGRRPPGRNAKGADAEIWLCQWAYAPPRRTATAGA